MIPLVRYGYLILPFSSFSKERVTIFLTVSPENPLSILQIFAHTPATWGAAIDVPLQNVSTVPSSLRYKDYNELIKMKKELEANSDEILATLKTVEWVYIYEGEGDCATIVCNTIRYGFTNGHEYHNEHTQVY